MIGYVYWWRGVTWMVMARGEPFDRGPRRNVLLRRCERVHGRVWSLRPETIVRPFRGLQRVDP